MRWCRIVHLEKRLSLITSLTSADQFLRPTENYRGWKLYCWSATVAFLQKKSVTSLLSRWLIIVPKLPISTHNNSVINSTETRPCILSQLYFDKTRQWTETDSVGVYDGNLLEPWASVWCPHSEIRSIEVRANKRGSWREQSLNSVTMIALHVSCTIREIYRVSSHL